VDLLITSIAERPELASRLDDFPGTWPTFLHHHRLSALFYHSATADFPDFCLVAVDRDLPEMPVAKAYSVPVSWDADEFPPEGHDAVIMRMVEDRLIGRPGRTVAAIEVTVQVAWQGRGVSGLMLEALRANAAGRGYADLVVPVRPTRKHEDPHASLAEYAARLRPDGLPVDPWLRTHVRAGGEIAGLAPCSMTLTAPLAAWREWTGLPFAETGPVLVPEALVPVHCDVTQDHAVYVEPNVWVRHRLA
jgi:GNAT superfamily N-acetyltransferase